MLKRYVPARHARGSRHGAAHLGSVVVQHRTNRREEQAHEEEGRQHCPRRQDGLPGLQTLLSPCRVCRAPRVSTWIERAASSGGDGCAVAGKTASWPSSALRPLRRAGWQALGRAPVSQQTHPCPHPHPTALRTGRFPLRVWPAALLCRGRVAARSARPCGADAGVRGALATEHGCACARGGTRGWDEELCAR